MSLLYRRGVHSVICVLLLQSLCGCGTLGVDEAKSGGTLAAGAAGGALVANQLSGSKDSIIIGAVSGMVVADQLNKWRQSSDLAQYREMYEKGFKAAGIETSSALGSGNVAQAEMYRRTAWGADSITSSGGGTYTATYSSYDSASPNITNRSAE